MKISTADITFLVPMTIIGGLMCVAVFLLHSTACGMHKMAVENLWSRQPETRNEYRWSHAYCEVVRRPAEWLMQ